MRSRGADHHDDATISKFIATFEALHPRQEGGLVHMYG